MIADLPGWGIGLICIGIGVCWWAICWTVMQTIKGPRK